ncbi:hypothetical protein ES707_15976 [subsurface metagenome]
MGDKRRITTATVSIALDGEINKATFEKAFLPDIKLCCFRQGQKYAPEVWLDNIETTEMEVILKCQP